MNDRNLERRPSQPQIPPSTLALLVCALRVIAAGVGRRRNSGSGGAKLGWQGVTKTPPEGGAFAAAVEPACQAARFTS
jgi:hypothetical protein